MAETDLKIQEYHAHVYFQDHTRETAEALRAALMQAFGARVTFHSMAYGPRGPHVFPMFGLDFPPSELEAVLSFLLIARRRHSVLIHPVTGNDLLDHTHHAIWLGSPQPLDLSVLA